MHFRMHEVRMKVDDNTSYQRCEKNSFLKEAGLVFNRCSEVRVEDPNGVLSSRSVYLYVLYLCVCVHVCYHMAICTCLCVCTSVNVRKQAHVTHQLGIARPLPLQIVQCLTNSITFHWQTIIGITSAFQLKQWI